ncbi:unnamed protein product [Effrenium voratum]|nr:unnamed protein product [Effrenium voratum]
MLAQGGGLDWRPPVIRWEDGSGADLAAATAEAVAKAMGGQELTVCLYSSNLGDLCFMVFQRFNCDKLQVEVRTVSSARTRNGRKADPESSYESGAGTTRWHGAKISTFVCVQSEVPAQSELRRWPAEGLKVKGRRCLPYARTAQQFAGARKLHFLHEPLEDLEVPGSEHLHAFTNKLEARLHQGETLLVHCMGGRGRSNLVAGCLLAKLYDLPADEVEQRLQLGYESRDYDNCLVPETQRQRDTLRAFCSALG